MKFNSTTSSRAKSSFFNSLTDNISRASNMGSYSGLITKCLTRVVASGIRDLTSKVEIQGKQPVFIGGVHIIWSGILGENTKVAIKLLRPAGPDDRQEVHYQ
ncbi:hypothetical protein K439DRAFT_550454 [Ramaria rubella]|nr:hypothetical protein K439DRAFT_550454 [Ramaria rubella]